MDQLETVRESITASLVAAYHHRVAYPDEDEMKREIERERQADDEED
jgi:membrane-associated HD superfamily phosphohydrolase